MFCCGRWVYSHATKVSLGSSGVVGLTRHRPRGRCVHLVVCSLDRHLGVLGFIHGLWVHSRAPWASFNSIREFGFTLSPPVRR